MNSRNPDHHFYVWGLDQSAYGPVELPTLVAWINDDRVFGDTWVFDETNRRWQLAAELPELREVFKSKTDFPGAPPAAANPAEGRVTLKPGALRRVKILATLSDAQLERFAQFMETESVRQWKEVVKQGEMSNAMYLILEGELRVRIRIGETEKILATLGPGEFFGDIALFDHGPRSADVVANQDSLVLKISSAAFEKFAREAPEIAAPFLFAIGRTLTARIRADNKRYRDTIFFSQAAGA